MAGARRCSRRAPSTYQPACKPGSVRRRANPPRDGHSSGTPVARRLQQPTRTARSRHRSRASRLRVDARAVPIRSCSRWGLPCRFRCRKRGALLPHRFTLAGSPCGIGGGLLLCGTFPGLCRACARFLPPDVIRHRMSMEPGLSSRGPPFGIGPKRPSGRLTRWSVSAFAERTQCMCGAMPLTDVRSVSIVDGSASPSTRSGRKWRWNAVTTCASSVVV